MTALVAYALSLLNTPYLWAGKNPLIGLDCSGLVQTLLRTVGMDPAGDQNAQAYYNLFKSSGVGTYTVPGSLAFYGKSETDIDHVALFINNYQVIEAAGGGSECTTTLISKEKGACVRIRPFKYRSDLVSIILPNYPAWVMEDIEKVV